MDMIRLLLEKAVTVRCQCRSAHGIDNAFICYNPSPAWQPGTRFVTAMEPPPPSGTYALKRSGYDVLRDDYYYPVTTPSIPAFYLLVKTFSIRAKR